MRVCCPHCHIAIEVDDGASLNRITCASCGSGFSLLGEETLSHRQQDTKRLGHFELTERIGTGAFGSVWKALDTNLDRMVAVKVPRSERLTRSEVELFLREAQAAAQVRHPNIVTVHEVGRDSDCVFIVSDYVSGLTLADWLTGKRSTARMAASLCQILADALHAAHEAGIIHRDLKPSNIILDADDQPHVTDFGLAKRETSEVTMTADGQVLGTPAYMSPEQAEGESHTVDRRTDIYSLGVILFELLTGEKPFRGNARMLMHQVIHEEPPSPRKLNATIPQDLETICLKCLEKSPARRYSTAKELSEEFDRFLAGEPIIALPIGQIAKAWRRCKRNPLASSLAAGLFLAVILGLFGTNLALQRERVTTTSQARQLYWSRVNLAYIALNSGDRNAFEVLMNELREPSTEYKRSIEWRYLLAREEEMWQAVELNAPSTVLTLSFAPSGELAVGCEDGTNYIYDTNNEDAALSPIDVGEGAVDFSPLGNYVITNRSYHSPKKSLPGDIRIWRFPGLEPLRRHWAIDPLTRISIGPKENLVALSLENATVEVRALPDGELLLQPLLHAGGYCAFSPTEPKLVTALNEKLLKMIDLDTGELLDETEQCVNLDSGELRFSPNGDYVLASGHYGSRLWRVEHNKLTRVDWHLDTETYSNAFSRDGYMATGCSDQTVKIWHLSDMRNQLANLVNPSMVTAVAFTHDGNQLATGCRGGSVRLWGSKHWRRPHIIASDAHFHPPFDVSPDRIVAVSGRTDNGESFRLVDLGSGQEQPLLQDCPETILCTAFSPDGRFVACGDQSGTIRVWDVTTSELLLCEREQQLDSVNCLAFSDHNSLAAGGNGRVILWEDLRDRPTKDFDGPEFVAALRFSPHEHLAIGGGESTSGPGTILVVDLKSDRVLLDAPTPECVRDVDFSPDGSLLALIYNFSAGFVRILDTQTWTDTEGSPLRCHSGKSTQLAFAGDRLITGSDNNVLRVWDLTHGELVGTLHVGGKVRDIKVLPGGNEFATISRKGAVRLWSAVVSGR